MLTLLRLPVAHCCYWCCWDLQTAGNRVGLFKSSAVQSYAHCSPGPAGSMSVDVGPAMFNSGTQVWLIGLTGSRQWVMETFDLHPRCHCQLAGRLNCQAYRSNQMAGYSSEHLWEPAWCPL